MINELPHKKHISKENLILSGIWFGEYKPNMAYFLIPQLESIQFLKKTGINVEWHNKETVTVKAMLLCGTFDMPAKGLVLNMMQYNGRYGCPVCLQAGKTVKTSTRGHVHAFPFDRKDPTGPLRSTSESKKHSLNAVNNENESYGIKGPCALNIQDNIDIIGGTSVDYMRGVLLGVTKLLMNLWFGKGHSSEDFLVHTRVSEIETHLLKMKPPNRITRVPRSFTQHLNYWKASEFRSWLLFYSLPALYDILPSIYYEHFALLSSAVFLLLQESISEKDLTTANKLLLTFCCTFSDMYGERYVTINVHQLLHLPLIVKRLGPLWVTSCFHFEDKNGFLLRMIHGTQTIAFQLCSALTACQSLPDLALQAFKTGSDEMRFYENCCHKKNFFKNMFQITSTCSGVGSKHLITNISPACFNAILDYVPADTLNQVFRFPKIVLDGQLILSVCGTKEQKRNSCVVQLRHKVENSACFFKIYMFVEVSVLCQGGPHCFERCHCQPVFLAIGNKLNVKSKLLLDEFSLLLPDQQIEHLHCCKIEEELTAVPIANIQKQCVHILDSNGRVHYVIPFPNYKETD